MRTARSRLRAFTLVEVIVALALVGILLTAVHSFVGLGRNASRTTRRLSSTAAAARVGMALKEDLQALVALPGRALFDITPAALSWNRLGPSGTEEVRYEWAALPGGLLALERNGRAFVDVRLREVVPRLDDDGTRVALSVSVSFESAHDAPEPCTTLTVTQVHRRRFAE